jgi:hypothetical protein
MLRAKHRILRAALNSEVVDTADSLEYLEEASRLDPGGLAKQVRRDAATWWGGPEGDSHPSIKRDGR